MAGEERNGAVQERDRGAGLFVVEDFGVGQAAVVVDRDVQVFPADPLATDAGSVGLAPPTRAATGDALARPTLDPPEPF